MQAKKYFIRSDRKKKSDLSQDEKKTEELPLPSKSEIIRETSEPENQKIRNHDFNTGKHSPSVEKPAKSFSIKNIISEEKKLILDEVKNIEESEVADEESPAEELNPLSFEKAWNDYIDQFRGEGTRIISMFKSVRTELEKDQIIRIHLSNAAQKDLFVQNYKQKLVTFLNRRFKTGEIDIETVVDLTETTEMLYSDEQKYNYLSSKYPELKDFRKAFNLDIT